jgi:uncharacterized membrane protein
VTVPTDKAHAVLVVAAPADDVLAVLRDVAAQPDWVPEVRSVEVLEEYEDGTVATAAFHLVTKIGSDSYTLEYTHDDDGMSWHLVEGRMQHGQQGAYRLSDLGEGGTEVDLRLTVVHSMPAPGFLRRRVFDNFVKGSLRGLKQYVEAASTGDAGA